MTKEEQEKKQIRSKLIAIRQQVDALTDSMADTIIDETGYEGGEDNDHIFDSHGLASIRDEIQGINDVIIAIEEKL